MSLIVTLSTIPPRFPYLEQALPYLLNQTAQIDEIRLYIPKTYRRFPDYDGGLPTVPTGIRIMQPDEDLGPATKILFAAEELRGQDVNIIYCDDDRAYEPDRFERMVAEQDNHKNTCIASITWEVDVEINGARYWSGIAKKDHPKFARKGLQYRLNRVGQFLRERRSGIKEQKPRYALYSEGGYAAIAEGCGGVLVKPDYFDEQVYDIPPVLWSVDDVWLSGHMARKGIKIWQPANFINPLLTDGSDAFALYDATLEGAGRNAANFACIEYMHDRYGIWK